MPKTVGVLVMEHIAVGLVEGNKIIGPLNLYPEQGDFGRRAAIACRPKASATASSSRSRRSRKVKRLTRSASAFPGVIRNGVSRRFPQSAPGERLPPADRCCLNGLAGGSSVPVRVFNDADAMAAGIAASRDKLHKLIRVWTLGNGVGFGRYPWSEGVWEGGHSVVTLDPKETLCGCGGRGHLEGILGHRSMRLRFLDLEPEEVFANAA